MKRHWIFILSLLSFFILIENSYAAGGVKNCKPDGDWIQNKYSMFVHWGLYSLAGGVWDGKPVEQGYSEQIQSFAGIFSDYYAALAQDFTAPRWNADSIVLLAKAGGMGAVVFTAKHHDGFSMYKTGYSKFNVVDATPFGRDPLKELSEACMRHGLKLGIYFSLIDWHFPQAYPISSHNADPVTPEHHRFNMSQVQELLTNYGPVSEIWFDMGSLTRQQSRELYELVNELQPQCMVSGRLGNDFGDFAVMGDNSIPDYPIGVPWQSACSMFRETWGYRSWQQRGRVEEKIAEKWGIYQNVLKHGGHFLLNIGPRGDGSVVDFERDVIRGLARNITPNRNQVPEKDVKKNPAGPVGKSNHRKTLVCELEPVYGYSCFDYYSSFRSIIGYEFSMNAADNGKYVVVYHEGDRGKELVFTVEDGWQKTRENGCREYRMVLEGGEPVENVNGLDSGTAPLEVTATFLLERGRNSFNERFIDTNALPVVAAAGWKQVTKEGGYYTVPVGQKQNVWFAHRIGSATNRIVLAEFGTADALEIWLNGKQLFKKGYTNVEPSPEVVKLFLQKGENLLLVKLHNRFENEIRYRFSTDIPQRFYQQAFPFKVSGKGDHRIILRLAEAHGGVDIGLRDLEIGIKSSR